MAVWPSGKVIVMANGREDAEKLISDVVAVDGSEDIEEMVDKLFSLEDTDVVLPLGGIDAVFT